MFELVYPPSALGSGHRGLANKVGHLVFAWALHSQLGSDLDSIGREFVCHISDMGVELSMPTFSTPSVSKLLPEWMQHVRLSCDVADDEPTDLGASDNAEQRISDSDVDVDGRSMRSKSSSRTP